MPALTTVQGGGGQVEAEGLAGGSSGATKQRADAFKKSVRIAHKQILEFVLT